MFFKTERDVILKNCCVDVAYFWNKEGDFIMCNHSCFKDSCRFGHS